eukprot:CAMPEP_0206023848 /NCGR_PEP_ID=MMETSP1464-20131121/37195_1 /ASSEMBLY_ACC=CAM_ASM_001124 /TAXON_ID=119497 /ORGANISM="Exanthemachrysis gayraliae, Strain RCC1523" /LENGTH=40 /DNA_ID= /DNA_START= /DNA_END= /DNA_ORIENTATION=
MHAPPLAKRPRGGVGEHREPKGRGESRGRRGPSRARRARL